MIDHRNKFQFVDAKQRQQIIDMFSQTDNALDMFPQTDEIKKRAVQTFQRMLKLCAFWANENKIPR